MGAMANCPRKVANAAPKIPMPKPSTNRPVKTILITIAAVERITGVTVSPCACRTAWKAVKININVISKDLTRR